MVEGVKELLFAVLRDVVYFAKTLSDTDTFDLSSSAGITDAVFHALRHADVFRAPSKTNLAVCWGGHSIPRAEYDYSKLVGYELGLRGLDVCTGCGPGAMKGPMKEALPLATPSSATAKAGTWASRSRASSPPSPGTPGQLPHHPPGH